jgi:hypothetical protein
LRKVATGSREIASWTIEIEESVEASIEIAMEALR